MTGPRHTVYAVYTVHTADLTVQPRGHSPGPAPALGLIAHNVHRGVHRVWLSLAVAGAVTHGDDNKETKLHFSFFHFEALITYFTQTAVSNSVLLKLMQKI